MLRELLRSLKLRVTFYGLGLFRNQRGQIEPLGINNRWAAFNSVPTLIDEKFEDGRKLAQTAIATATETINELATLANTINLLNINLPNVSDIQLPNIGDFVGDKPVAPVIELHMPPETYLVDDVDGAVHDKLLHDLLTKSPAIPADIQEAIAQLGVERDQLILQDAKDKISDDWSKRGFTLPNGMLKADIDWATIEYMNKRLDTSRSLDIKNFELTDANMKFAVEKGIARYAIRIEVYKTQVQAEISRIKTLVDTFIGDVEVFKGEAQVYETVANVLIKKFDAEITSTKLKADIIIANANIEIKNYEVMYGLKVRAMEAIGNMNAQLVAGALSSVHAGVSIGVSDAGSYSYSSNPSY